MVNVPMGHEIWFKSKIVANPGKLKKCRDYGTWTFLTLDEISDIKKYQDEATSTSSLL